jgi:hypothetical protein
MHPEIIRAIMNEHVRELNGEFAATRRGRNGRTR